MGEKFEKLKSDLETGDASGIEDTFHQDYLYLKDNTLVNREEHVEFMKTQFGKKISVINPEFLYEDKDMMTYSYNINVRGKNYRVVQVQMWKDGKIWREMSNAVESS
tara:strand:- start:160 stop:480 length:321 start_codon:yes stop_codon:yes gene_type:complete